MPSKKCLLPTEIGRFTNIPHDRVAHIRRAAKAAARAYAAGDAESYGAILSAANADLSKHERGVFSAFLIAGAAE